MTDVSSRLALFSSRSEPSAVEGAEVEALRLTSLAALEEEAGVVSPAAAGSISTSAAWASSSFFLEDEATFDDRSRSSEVRLAVEAAGWTPLVSLDWEDEARLRAAV